jgi:hypothetical protein
MNELDKLPLLGIFIGCVATQLIFIEFGYRWGSRKGGKPNKAQMAQVRAIMGASLGLLAFMLAFSFNTAQSHFEERTRAYMLEVSAIDSAFRGADLIKQEERQEAKDLLAGFARLRVETSEAAATQDRELIIEMIRESERIHDRLWALAERSMEGAGDGEDTGIFAQAVLAMIDAHDGRLQTIFFNRVSPIIWLTLLGMAVLSMAVTGYQAGLTGTRSSLATWTLAISFAFVMILITDLDRPVMTLFEANSQLMVELQNRMEGGDYWDPTIHGNK